MVNVKLTLQPQDMRLAELESALTVLQGTVDLSIDNIRKIGSNPAYPTKTPGKIIADYLTKVCECACRTIEPESLTVTKTPVDLVVTVPVNWSYEANNATFRTLREAGFNKKNFPTLDEMILISEPEAASYFTVQDLQSRKADFLKVGDCFVLCDAGGGTVDVVAFQITAETPHTKLKRLTIPNSRKCGAAYIDAAFKTWLRDTALGSRYYSRLDPADKGQSITPNSIETRPMRELIKRFELEKIRFESSSHDIRIELPAPLNKLSIEGRVREGELTIYKDEMRSFFNPSINGVIGLVEQQTKQLSEGFERRLKSVLLVGGFGASKYLQEMLKESLLMRKIKMHRPDPDKSWTAVVQGAVIYGIEKAACRASNFWVPSQKLDKRQLDLDIWRYPLDDDDEPEALQSGRHDVEQAGIVSCDLSRFVHRISKRPAVGQLKVDFRLSDGKLTSEVTFNDNLVGSYKTEVTAGL